MVMNEMRDPREIDAIMKENEAKRQKIGDLNALIAERKTAARMKRETLEDMRTESNAMMEKIAREAKHGEAERKAAEPLEIARRKLWGDTDPDALLRKIRENNMRHL